MLVQQLVRVDLFLVPILFLLEFLTYAFVWSVAEAEAEAEAVEQVLALTVQPVAPLHLVRYLLQTVEMVAEAQAVDSLAVLAEQHLLLHLLKVLHFKAVMDLYLQLTETHFHSVELVDLLHSVEQARAA